MTPFVGNLNYFLEILLEQSNEIYAKIQKLFVFTTFFETFMVVEILTSEDEDFRDATCNNIEKLWRQITGLFSKLIS